MSRALDYSSLGAGTADFWNGFQRLNFQVLGRASCLILPPEPHPGRPWIWRPTFLDAWPGADLALLRGGFHLAYTEVLDWYGAAEGLDQGAELYRRLTECGLNRRFAFVALSRGGIYAYRYAALHPEQVACIYADAPVCDVRSWPGGRGLGEYAREEWAQLLRANGVTETEALSDDFQPLYHLGALAEARIPLLHVCGDSDSVVPMEENSGRLGARYRDLGGPFEMIVKPGVGHHPHGLEDPAPIVEFIRRHSAWGA